MSKFIPLIVALAWLIFVTPVTAANSTAPEGTEARQRLAGVAMAHFINDRFDELEKMANEMRSTKARFADGGWKIFAFYDWPLRNIQSEKTWDIIFQGLQRWREKYPASITARVTTANAYVKYAWIARGDGFADSITESGRLHFKERLGRAYSFVQATPPKAEDDCPYRYIALQNISKGLGWEKEAQRRIFEIAVQLEPDFFGFYTSRAFTLLPRWYGEEGEWLKFAEDATKYTSAREGESIYTRIASNIYDNGVDIFKEKGMSWPRMKQGFRDIARNFPDSQLNLNSFCQFACRAGDKETTKELVQKIGAKPLMETWKTQAGYENCRTWAEAP